MFYFYIIFKSLCIFGKYKYYNQIYLQILLHKLLIIGKNMYVFKLNKPDL